MQTQAILHSSSSGSQKQVSKLLQSFCMASLGFVIAVLFHQLVVGTASMLLGYETSITFGKVVSKPFDVQYWSGSRVIFIYALPAIFILALSAFLMAWLLRTNRQIKNWYLLVFWFITFNVLYITTEMTISPITALFGRGIAYQGITIVVRWFSLQLYWTIALVLISVIINLGFGYFGFKVLYLYRPSSRDMYLKEYLQQIVLSNFIYPLLLVLPLAVVMTYPDSTLFFVIMLLHGLVLVPGFIIRSKYMQTDQKRKRIKRVTPVAAYTMVAAIVLLTIVVRLFL